LRYLVTYDVDDSHHLRYYLPRDVDSLTKTIREWADEVKLTTEAPDLWAGMQSSREFISDIQDGDSANTPFTEDEQNQIAAQLQEIKKQLKERFELTSEQMEQVEERLDEAVEASKRMSRKDWLLLFSGIIFTSIITATVTPGSWRTYLHYGH
jgi:hypothetical protein